MVVSSELQAEHSRPSLRISVMYAYSLSLHLLIVWGTSPFTKNWYPVYLPSTLPCSHVSLLLPLVSSFSCLCAGRHLSPHPLRRLVSFRFPSRTLESGVWERDCTLNGCMLCIWNVVSFRTANPNSVDAHTSPGLLQSSDQR